MCMKHLLKLLALGVIPTAVQADTLFGENFDSATLGSTDIDGWTFLDAPAAGDHPSLGVRASGDPKGGATVTTVSGTGNFLNGGRSAIFSARVGKIIKGNTYTFTFRARDVGSSYAISHAYFTTSAPTGYVTSAENTLGGFASATTTPTENGWQEYRATYKGTELTAGLELYINLQSSRNSTSGVRGWDDIVVKTIPEPATYGLLAAATLATILGTRRRS